MLNILYTGASEAVEAALNFPALTPVKQDLPVAPPPRRALRAFDPENPGYDLLREVPLDRIEGFDARWELADHLTRRNGARLLTRLIDEMRTDGVTPVRQSLGREIQTAFPGIDLNSFTYRAKLGPRMGGGTSTMVISSGGRTFETQDTALIQKVLTHGFCESMERAAAREGRDLPRGFVTAYLNRCRAFLHLTAQEPRP